MLQLYFEAPLFAVCWTQSLSKLEALRARTSRAVPIEKFSGMRVELVDRPVQRSNSLRECSKNRVFSSGFLDLARPMCRAFLFKYRSCPLDRRTYPFNPLSKRIGGCDERFGSTLIFAEPDRK
jgi:hypothetical protein